MLAQMHYLNQPTNRGFTDEWHYSRWLHATLALSAMDTIICVTWYKKWTIVAINNSANGCHTMAIHSCLFAISIDYAIEGKSKMAQTNAKYKVIIFPAMDFAGFSPLFMYACFIIYRLFAIFPFNLIRCTVCVCAYFFLFISFLLPFLRCLLSSSHIHFRLLLLISPEIRCSVACASQTLLALVNNTNRTIQLQRIIWVRAFFDGMQIIGFADVGSAHNADALLVSNRNRESHILAWLRCI